jgi:putative transposase
MTHQFKRLAHSLYECKYHLVFCPKYRYKILQGEGAEYMKLQIYGLCQQKDQVEVLELNVRPDHVHLVVSVPPKYAVSSFVGYLKGKLAIRMFERYEKLGRRYWGRHLWARG